MKMKTCTVIILLYIIWSLIMNDWPVFTILQDRNVDHSKLEL